MFSPTTRRLTLSILCVASAFAFGRVASADLVPDGITFVPVDVTFDGQSAFADTTFVVLGCNSHDGGRHNVGIVKAGQPLRCSIKHAPTVHAIANKDLKPFTDLVAKDEGWAQESIDAKKLAEGKPSCGSLDEKTSVDKSSKTTFFTSRYALTKTATGCSMKKVGDSIAQTTPLTAMMATAPSNGDAAASPMAGGGDASVDGGSASPAASDSAGAMPSASSSATPAPSSSTGGDTPPPPKSGCGSCAIGGSDTSTSSSSGLAAAFAALAIAASFTRRRRSR